MSGERSSQVIDEYERGVPGSKIYVFDGDNAAATFSDAGLTVPLAQPIITDAFGGYTYYAADGFYTEEIWYGGKLRERDRGIPVGAAVGTLSDEALIRANADFAEAGNRATAVASEMGGRVAGDAALQTALNSEAQLRASGDSALASAIPGLTNATANAASRAILIGLTAAFAAGLPAQLNEGVRQGIFLPMTAADYAARTGRVLATDIAIDSTTLGGFKGNLILPVGGDLSGASGAWVYPYWAYDVPDRLFGATDGTDLQAALQAWSTVTWQLPCKSTTHIANGTTAASITLGYTVDSITNDIRLCGTVKATAAMDSVIVLRNIKNCAIHYNLYLWGANSTDENLALASRLAKNGLTLSSSSHSTATGTLRGYAFIYWAFTIDWANVTLNHFASIPYVRGKSCGSSPRAGTTYQLTANWTAFSSTQTGSLTNGSAVVTGLTSTTGMLAGMGVTGTGVPPATKIISVDSSTQITLSANYTGTTGTQSLTIQARGGGGPNSLNQTTIISVDAAPGADPQRIPQFIKLGGYYYPAQSITGSGPYTVTLSCPWVANAAIGAGSGTCAWVFGGAVGLIGNASSTMLVSAVSSQFCGFCLYDGTAYGAVALRVMAGSADTEVWYCFGSTTAGLKIGGKVVGGYSENTPVIIVFCNPSSTGTSIGTVDGHGIDPASIYKMAPRVSLTTDAQVGPAITGGGGLCLTELNHIDGFGGKLLMAQNASPLTATWDPPSIADGAYTQTTMTLPYISDLSLPLRARFSVAGNYAISAVLTANNSSAGTATATITIVNRSGGALDLASGTVSLELLK